MGDHYIPQFYLKGFTSEEGLWVHDRLQSKSFRSIPKSVANENKMYGQELEQYLANLVEEPANFVIDKIRRSELINQQDREDLASYIIKLWKRVPKGRDRVSARMPEIAEEVRKKYHAVFDAHVETTPEDAEKVHIKRGEIDDVINKYIETRPPDIWQRSLAMEGSSLPEAALLEMDWHFLTSRTPDFLTCDNPVFFFEHEGIANQQAELTLPLSSQICLWAHKHGGKRPYFYEALPAAKKEINRRTVYNASRFVFSARHESWMLPFVLKGTSHQLNRLKF